jgi:hypothetical protein
MHSATKATINLKNKRKAKARIDLIEMKMSSEKIILVQ